MKNNKNREERKFFPFPSKKPHLKKNNKNSKVLLHVQI
jgi:hypothetical protein